MAEKDEQKKVIPEPQKDWRIVRQRPEVKQRIERTAEKIHKNQREGGRVSMETARKLADSAVRQSYFYENFVPDRFKPKPATKSGFLERGIDGEITDKDKIVKEMENGNIPQAEPSGKVTIPQGKLWVPPAAR